MVTVTGRILPPPLLQYGGKAGGMIPVREGGREGGKKRGREREINCCGI